MKQFVLSMCVAISLAIAATPSPAQEGDKAVAAADDKAVKAKNKTKAAYDVVKSYEDNETIDIANVDCLVENAVQPLLDLFNIVKDQMTEEEKASAVKAITLGGKYLLLSVDTKADAAADMLRASQRYDAAANAATKAEKIELLNFSTQFSETAYTQLIQSQVYLTARAATQFTYANSVMSKYICSAR